MWCTFATLHTLNYFFSENTEAIKEPKLSFKLGTRRQSIVFGSCSRWSRFCASRLVVIFSFFPCFEMEQCHFKIYLLVPCKNADNWCWKVQGSGKRYVKSLRSSKMQSLITLKLCRLQGALQQQMLNVL